MRLPANHGMLCAPDEDNCADPQLKIQSSSLSPLTNHRRGSNPNRITCRSTVANLGVLRTLWRLHLSAGAGPPASATASSSSSSSKSSSHSTPAAMPKNHSMLCALCRQTITYSVHTRILYTALVIKSHHITHRARQSTIIIIMIMAAAPLSQGATPPNPANICDVKLT
jgi:hypothetical protein